MSDFSVFEKSVAKLLGNVPSMKIKIKRIYQFCAYILTRKSYTFVSDYKVDAVDKTRNESFFGYYDKSPENMDGSYVLFHRSERETAKLPSSHEKIEIVCKDVGSGVDKFICRTNAYNWQQGSRLFWLNTSTFIFNDFSNGDYVAKLVDLQRDSLDIMPLPVYDGYKKDYYLSCSFERLNQLRPDYGYRNRRTSVYWDNISEEGIFKYTFDNSETKLIISIKKLVELFPIKSMSEAMHKVNHIMISPDGKNFIFMHRWHKKNGLKYDRLLVSDRQGSFIYILADEGVVSHCCWKTNSKIIGYLKYNGQLGWYEIDILTRDTTLISDKLAPLGDGHPTYRKGNLLIDTYPNRSRMKKLYIYDYDTDNILQCGEFYESLKYNGQTRCDLHPRYNVRGDTIYVDSVHTGQRRLYRLT